MVPNSSGTEVYVFDYDGRHLYTKTGLTGAIKYTFNYDGDQKLISIVDAYGNTTTFHRGTGGVLTSVEAPRGQITTVTTNSSGLLSSVTSPASETYQFTYKSGTDLLQTFTKPAGQVSTFSYNANGRLTKDLGHAGNFWELLEDLQVDQRVVTKSSKLGREETFYSWGQFGGSYTYAVKPSGQEYESGEDYEGWGGYTWTPQMTTGFNRAADWRFKGIAKRVISSDVTIGSSSVTTTYDQTLNPSSITDPFTFTTLTKSETTNGKVNSSVYTASTRTTITTTPEGATRTSVINLNEKPTSFQVGTDTAWTFTYDSAGRPLVTSQGSRHTKTNTYSTNGFLSKVTDVLGNETSYAYDLAGRVTLETRPDGKFITYTYDANGNLTGVTPPSRPEHVFQFNAMELISQYNPPALSGLSVKDTIYSYNLDKQPTNILRPDGQSVAMVYGSSSGLLNQVQLSRGNNTYQYMSDSDYISQIESADGMLSEYGYYGTSRSSESQKRASDGYLYASYQYSFDSEHRLSSRSLTGHSTTSPSVTTYTYNNDNQPTQIGDLQLTYSYPSGRLSTTTIGNISDSTTYDSYGALSGYSATYTPTTGPAQVLYSYSLVRDNAGRITEKTETVLGTTDVYEYSYDNVGRLSSVTKNSSAYSSYSYDDNGNRTSGVHAGTSFTATYDNQDRLLTWNTRSYSHNANGDITGIQWNTTQSSAFNYDALGNLIAATDISGNNLVYKYDGQNHLVQGSKNGTFAFGRLYENNTRLIAEFDVNGSNVKEFVFLKGEQNSPEYIIVGGLNYKVIKDHLGSPRLVVKASDGSVLQRMDYTDLGKIVVNTNPSFQPFGFAGGLVDQNTGLVKFGARLYDPDIGRWTSKDPILFGGKDSNLYAYVMQDPVNWTDPSGTTMEDSMKELDEFFSRQEKRNDDLKESAGKCASDQIQDIKNYFKETSKDAIETTKRMFSVF